MTHLILFLLVLLPFTADSSSFAFHGFHNAALLLDGTATITDTGLLRLTNGTKMLKAHAFHPQAITFKPSPTSPPTSFSTTFVFGIQFTEISGHGIVFFLSRTTNFSSATSSQYLGLFNASDSIFGSSNHIVAVELDTIQNPELKDIDNNHIGIDIDSLVSVNSTSAGYFSDDHQFTNISLSSGDPIQVWVDYDNQTTQIVVKLSLFGSPKPQTPLLSHKVVLSDFINETMFVGFSATTDPFQTSHYILGWSFNTSGEALLDLSSLPSLPPTGQTHKRPITIWLPTLFVVTVTFLSGLTLLYILHRIKFGDLIEDWEEEYGPHRLPYKTLFDSTKGFAESELLGSGGFGKVYKGYLPTSNTHIAVKRISHESRQGVKEFIAEIVSIGRVRHRNLVQLVGYCRRRRELLLVYEYMPHGSLDRALFTRGTPTLTWQQRVHVIKGVAFGLRYLHEEWEQVVIHRDVKASNVLLDSEYNGKLGDFGLARLYDHGTDPRTTHVVGTMGYLAPELTRISKGTKATDVFAFGVFVLEVVSGRRPIEFRNVEEEVVLVDWVVDTWRKGEVYEVVDRRVRGECGVEEVERLVRLGLVCCHPMEGARPGMREVVRVLEGEVEVPELAAQFLDAAELERMQADALGEVGMGAVVEYRSSFATGSFVMKD